ncbi:regulatory protein MerR [Caldalkalibacillus thermarum TA2.A1]|uniref:Regulatory protein MerR n=1 Tax=Caldalkalibacillus thermarum (strain TA2.A1) TaxID=986075 RepID=F5L7I7_CALTT|nr:regulatory protein MerR [Caldalkalibacillus thermarum TA2.A1]
MKKQETYSISQLAQEFDISTRTIRYYEERGLLNPERTPGGTRRYTKGDRARVEIDSEREAFWL